MMKARLLFILLFITLNFSGCIGTLFTAVSVVTTAHEVEDEYEGDFIDYIEEKTSDTYDYLEEKVTNE